MDSRSVSLDASHETPMDRERSPSLFTLVGVVEGDILNYVEMRGGTTLRRLIQGLEWPSSLVVMAAGALIRQGLVRGNQHELEAVLVPAN